MEGRGQGGSERDKESVQGEDKLCLSAAMSC